IELWIVECNERYSARHDPCSTLHHQPCAEDVLKTNRLLIATIAAAMLAGCDRAQQKTASTGPTTQPAQTVTADTLPQPAPAIDSADAKIASATTSTMPAGVSFMVHQGTSDRIY